MRKTAAAWLASLRDAADILSRARNPLEAARALVPAPLRSRRVLNRDAHPSGGGRSAGEIAVELRRLTRRLESEVLQEDGRGVGYARLRASPLFGELEVASRALAGLSRNAIPRATDAPAFWINLYNVLVIHGVASLGIERSVMEVPSFFGTVAYAIADLTFTPDDVENGVLRANAPHPATRMRPFSAADPRLALSTSRVDPRVHTALVCAAKACPPIAFYDDDRLDAQLDLAARSFVENDVEIDAIAREVRVSLVYRYYLRDFGGDEGVRGFLLAHLEGARRDALLRAFESRWPLTHRRYDWRLNEIA